MLLGSVTPMTAQPTQPNWIDFAKSEMQPIHPCPKPSGVNTEMASVLETIKFQAAEIAKLRNENRRLRGCAKSLGKQLKIEKLRSASRKFALNDMKQNAVACNS